MWTLTLALCAFVAYVDGAVVEFEGPPVASKGKPKKVKAYELQTIAIDNVFIYEWSGIAGSDPKPEYRRAHVKSWAVREGDNLYIVAPGAFPAQIAATKYQKVTKIDGVKMWLGDTKEAENVADLLKAGNLFVMTNDRDGQVKPKGWILVSQKHVPEAWEGDRASLSTKKVIDHDQEIYDANKVTANAQAEALAKEREDEVAKEREKEAKKKEQQKEHQKTLLYIAQHKKQNSKKARYADDGDYYGYAGGAYDEEDIGYQGIDSSRLMQYARKRGLYAGSKKANRIKRRKDYR